MWLTHAPPAPPLAGAEPRAQPRAARQARGGRRARRGRPAPAVVTDQAVPEGHKGLHGYLYGENGAEVHEQRSEYFFRQDQDDGVALTAVPEYLAERARDSAKAVGVYALHDAQQRLQYIGFSRAIASSIQTHLDRVGPQRCATARVLVVRNRAMTTRQSLESISRQWLQEAGSLPPGNGPDQGLWEGLISSAEHEEKKLKMRKAMGENLHDAPAAEPEDSRQRRLNTIRAVEGDDWSEVIDRQTSEAVAGPALETAQLAQGHDAAAPSAQAAAAIPAQPPSSTAAVETATQAAAAAASAAASTSGPGRPAGQAPVTPFAQARVHRSIGEAGPARAMTLETVDRALDEVRPFLMADGGNVTTVDVADGVVQLRLEGACGTCASSTSTMKMGIERALQAAFGEQLKGVEQVDSIDMRATVAAVNSHLDQLRAAIKSYGGQVQVLKVEDGVCTVSYQGPAPIGMGIQAAIKDKFPDIRTVLGC